MHNHNFTHELKKEKNGGFLLKITLDKDQIQATYSIILAYLSKSLDIKGFRKGQVPPTIALKHLNPETILGETLNELVNQAYSHVLEDEKMHPVMDPQIKLLNPPLELGKAWEMEFIGSTRPILTLSPSWADKIKKIKDDNRDSKVKKVLALLEAESSVELAPVLLEADIKTSGKTKEIVQKEWALNLALEEIANTQKLTVDPTEIEAILAKPENKSVNPNLVGYLLRQQKTIDYLLTL